MGLLTGVLTGTMCAITEMAVASALAVPSTGLAIPYTVAYGAAICGPIVSAAAACPIFP